MLPEEPELGVLHAQLCAGHPRAGEAEPASSLELPRAQGADPAASKDPTAPASGTEVAPAAGAGAEAARFPGPRASSDHVAELTSPDNPIEAAHIRPTSANPGGTASGGNDRAGSDNGASGGRRKRCFSDGNHNSG